VIALTLVVSVVVGAVIGLVLLRAPVSNTSSSSSSTSASSSITASSSISSSVSTVHSSSSLSSSGNQTLPFGIISFQFDPSIDAVFVSTTSGTVAEINATTNKVINPSYYASANITSIVLDSALNELYVNLNAPVVQTCCIVENGTTVAINVLSGKVTSTFPSQDGVQFAVGDNLYLLSGISALSQQSANLTVVNATTDNVIQVIPLIGQVSPSHHYPCNFPCAISGVNYDPPKALAYLTFVSIGNGGGHGWSVAALDTDNNSFLATSSSFSFSHPIGVAVNPSNGLLYLSSAWDSYKLGLCSFELVPGNNVSIVNGTNIMQQFRVNTNNASTYTYNGQPSQSGNTCTPPPNYGSPSGINDTLGSIAYDQNNNGEIYVANGTVSSSFTQYNFFPQPNTRDISVISTSGPIAKVLNLSASANGIFFDPASASLYVSLVNNQTSLVGTS
jgi:hypothetical protein